MNRPLRLGAVSYLNVRPLVYGLDRTPGISLRFDVPAECARLLAEDEIDLGMVPSITYTERPDDRIVPEVCIGSDGPVASVALFSRVPIARVRSIALDTSSRTSVVLTRILCKRRFDIDPVLAPHAPDLAAMLAGADAALVIGDNALFADAAVHGATKVDLGAAWTDMTGLPFVWAFWSGRSGAVDQSGVERLVEAARQGMAHVPEIAASYCAGNAGRIGVAERYLRENLAYALDARALQGLRTYYREAEGLGLVPTGAEPSFY